MSLRFIIVFVGILLATPSESARILGLFADPVKSHVLIHTAITDALIERGHDVTVVTNVPLAKKNLQYRHIQLDIEEYPKDFMSQVISKPKPFYKRFAEFSNMVTRYANASLNQPVIQKMMAEESFDLFILGYFFNDFHLGVAAHFKCPVVVSYMIQTHRLTNDLVGNPKEIAYVPNVLTRTKQPLNFWNRVKNFVFTALFEEIWIPFAIHKQQEKFYK